MTARAIDRPTMPAPEDRAILRVTDLTKEFAVGGGFLKKATTVHAVNGISFHVEPRETVSLVGESGCGKTTVGKTAMGFYRPTSGAIQFDGREVGTLNRAGLRSIRRDLQYVFQDPYASLPSRATVNSILTEPLEIHGVGTRSSRQARASELLDLVGLRPALGARYPHEFSGGQRQRIGIARALALEPKMLILDEPVSALDVSVQAQVVNLLDRLQDELNLSYLFIAHDLGVVRHISDRIVVMYLGTIVEYGDVEEIFERPQHPYTQALLSAVPVPDPRNRAMGRRRLLQGDLPSPTNIPSGCAFRTRCWRATERCALESPELAPSDSTALSACHYTGPGEHA